MVGLRRPASFSSHPAAFIQLTLRAVIQDVVDGDTVIAEVDLGFNRYEWMTLRLFNINAPEIFSAKTPEEKQAGILARNRVSELVAYKPVLLVTYKDHEKYGRYLASIFYYTQGNCLINLEAKLVSEGHAVLVSPKVSPATVESL